MVTLICMIYMCEDDNSEEIDDYKELIRLILNKIITCDSSYTYYNLVINNIPCELILVKESGHNNLRMNLYTNLAMKDERPNLNSDPTIKFSNNKFLFENHYDIPTEVDNLFEDIEKLITLKFFKDNLVTKDEFDLLRAFNLYLYKVQEKELPKCYICLNYSNEYKTHCNHPVCIQCLNKFLSNGFEACGICSEKLYYECD